MKRELYLILTVLLVSLRMAYGQTNTDTPNLSFEDGSFNGWKQFTGNYFYNTTSGAYEYSWTPTINAGNRIRIINNNSSVPDPVIYCGGGLFTNPDNKLVARIGEPLRVEGYKSTAPYSKNAAAEKLEYSFVITENTTLLSYKLAAVLHEPPLDNHKGEQRPSYNMEITVTDNNGMVYVLPCASYSSKADVGNTSLTRNIACSGSISSRPTEYVYQKWLSGNLDLSNHIGRTLTITITNHDCLLDFSTHTDIAGSHPAYGYFWAETKRIELSTFSCENADATIVAPTGFSSYNWSRSDGKPIASVSASQPHIAIVEQSQNLENIRYYCEMNDASSSCGSITVSTIIDHVKITPNFTNFAVDAGKIQFIDNSTAVGDIITNYYWDFGDGSYSALKNPEHTYYDFIPYNVKLTVTTSKGCTKTISHNVLPTKELIVDIFPPANLQYNGQTKDFTATTNIAGLQMNIDYFIRYVNRPGTPYYNSFTAPATVGDYVATFELSHVNLLKYYIDNTPIKHFTITKAPLTITVNNAEKTYGETKTLQREGFTMSMNPLFAGDKIYELEMLCDALPATAQVAHYPIVATQAIGMGVSNYDIQFVPGNFVVHPKAITVSAINNTKTYGTAITPTGTEFYIAPNALVGVDAISSVELQSTAFAIDANVGNHAIVINNATGHRLSNYNISYNNATLTVDKKNVEISILPITKTYGETYTFTGKEFMTDKSQFIDNDSINTLQLASAGSATKANVGDYAIAMSGITGNRLDNYNIKINAANFRVNPKPLSIIANSTNKAFGNNLIFDGTEFSTDVPLVTGDNISFVLIKSNGAGSSAPIGSYDIVPASAHGVGSLNYTFTYINGTLNVIKKDITADIFPPANLSYNAQAKTFTATTSDSNLQLHSHYVIRYFNADNSYNSTTAPSNAGEYTAAFELTNAGALNYELAYAPTKTFVITKANITIKANDAIKTYGDNWVLSNDAFEANLKPLYGSDMISSVEFMCAGLTANALVGDYDIDISKVNGSGLANYEIAIEKGNFKVLKRNLRIQALDVSKVYGDNYLASGKEFFVDPISLANNDTVQALTLASTGFVAHAPAGTYVIVPNNATGRGLENYNLQYNNATLYVTRKNITVSAATITKTYGDTYTFSAKEFNYDKAQMIGTDSIDSAQLQSAATIAKAPVGDHQLSIVSLSGYRLENYNIKMLNGTLRVTQKNITIRANNSTKPYGELLNFTGKEFSTDQELIAGDSIYFVIFSSAGIEPSAPVGNYSIFPSMAYGNAVLNYNFSYLPGQLSVAQQTISASIAPPEQLVYNAQPKTCTATLSIASLKQNEHFFVRYTDKNNPANSSYAAPTNAGNYSAEIELSYATSINYTLLNNAKVDFEIAKAPLNIKANNATKQYGQSLTIASDAFSTSPTPLFGSDKVLSIATTCAGLPDTCSVGNYNIVPHTATGNGLNNYAITYANGTLDIQPKTISVRAANASKVYGDVLSNVSKGFIVNTNALLHTDSITSITTQSLGQNANATVGNYPLQIIAAHGKRLNNYTLQFVDGNLQVTPKSIIVLADTLSKEYGSEYILKGTEFTINNADLIGNDKINTAKLNSIATQKTASVGEYMLSITDVSGYGLENYNIKFENATFKVRPRNITITANNINKEYGDVYSFTGNEFSIDRPLLNNDNIAFVFMNSNGATESAAIGTYPIAAAMASGNGSLNYNIRYVAGQMTVTQKQLNIQINSAEKEYGQADPAFSFRVFDTRGVEYLPSMISGKPERDAGEKPNVYNIKKGNLACNQNYNLNIVEGKLTIKKALPQISAAFSNDTQKTIISYITGTPNANIPTGKISVNIPSCGINISANVKQGTANCMLMDLPADEVLVHIHYAGDENYLPVSRSIKLYAIRYHSNGGDLLNPITHFDGNETIRPETPTRQQRYRFEGWYENPDFEGNPLQRIVLGTYRNVDLYAKWVTSFDDLSVVVLFNQVLAVANPLKREFLERATYKWFRNGQQIEGNKQYIGFENYVPTGEYKVEIYYDGNIPIVLELKHTATVPMSKIYPNPAKVNAPVQIESAYSADENTQIELFSSDGKRLALSNIEKRGNSFTFNTSHKAGIYFVRIVQNGITIETHKLIIEDK